MVDAKTLKEMVDDFATRRYESADRNVEIGFNFCQPLPVETSQANRALKNMSTDERIEFLQLFVEKWNASTVGDNRRDLECIVTDRVVGWNKDPLIRLIYTLNQNGTQFRCWLGAPGRIMPDHVDSCGIGNLFTVSADNFTLDRYIDALVAPHLQRSAVTLSNGVKIWGFVCFP